MFIRQVAGGTWSPHIRRAHVVRVVKALSDLPDSYVLPNGRLSVPLEPLGAEPLRAAFILNCGKDPNKSPERRRGRPKAPKILPAAAEPFENAPKQTGTQLSRAIEENLLRFPHCLLLTRVGQFYESYYDQANEIAHLLNIKLTSRKWNGSRVLMCGFPLSHIDKHLKTLVQNHRRFVALCEEFPKVCDSGEKEFERRVTRIVTPGTLIDEPFLNPFENNYLLSIHSAAEIGLAWTDVSTGEFFSKVTTLETLQDELVRIGPKEVVLASPVDNSPSDLVITMLKEEGIFFSFPTAPPKNSAVDAEGGAISLLSDYLQTNLMENTPSLSTPLHETNSNRMQIDAHTIKSLEIRERTYEASTKGSLVSVIRRTTTSSGSRLLARRLCCPSTSIAEIEGWQSTVAYFLSQPHLRADLIEQLKEVGDIGRIVQRFTLKRGDISDLMAVKKTIDLWGSMTKRFGIENKYKKRPNSSGEQKHINILQDRTELDSLSGLIETMVVENVEDEEGKAILQDVVLSGEASKWSINPESSRNLLSLHSALKQLLKKKDDLESKLRIKFSAPSLTLRISPSQGIHVHIARSKRDSKDLESDSSFMKIAESASTKCYFYQKWSELGMSLRDMTVALEQAERRAFESLREKVVNKAPVLRLHASIIDEIDVAIGFATLAEELKFARPILTEERIYHVVNGRHPAVEMGLLGSGRTFTPNTIEMTPSSHMHIITGPNMAGKSTALRQTALIAVLAQVGSFVPADSAKIGIIDKLFTRIGAKDDLFRDRSTFMVEMLETADILCRATPRSLVIMDEVGRGTTVKDGLAIAFASVHHLVTTNQSSCLFATHFHELSDMIGCSANWEGKGVFNSVRFQCTDVNEIDDVRFVYSYRLRPGVNRDSHGLKVARLAGLPGPALEIATKTLAWLKAQSETQKALPQLNTDASEITLV